MRGRHRDVDEVALVGKRVDQHLVAARQLRDDQPHLAAAALRRVGRQQVVQPLLDDAAPAAHEAERALPDAVRLGQCQRRVHDRLGLHLARGEHRGQPAAARADHGHAAERVAAHEVLHRAQLPPEVDAAAGPGEAQLRLGRERGGCAWTGGGGQGCRVGWRLEGSQGVHACMHALVNLVQGRQDMRRTRAHAGASVHSQSASARAPAAGGAGGADTACCWRSCCTWGGSSRPPMRTRSSTPGWRCRPAMRQAVLLPPLLLTREGTNSEPTLGRSWLAAPAAWPGRAECSICRRGRQEETVVRTPW